MFSAMTVFGHDGELATTVFGHDGLAQVLLPRPLILMPMATTGHNNIWRPRYVKGYRVWCCSVGSRVRTIRLHWQTPLANSTGKPY